MDLIEECLRCGEETTKTVKVWDAEECELCGTHTGYVCIECLDDDDEVAHFQIDPRNGKYVHNGLIGFKLEELSKGKLAELNPPETVEKAWKEYRLKGFNEQSRSQ